MKISSSRNVIKSKDAENISTFVPMVQTMDYRKMGREKVNPQISPSEDKVEENQEAEHVLEEANRVAEELRQEAEEVCREAQEQAALARQKATEEGYREGFEWGLEEGRKKACEEHEAMFAKEREAFKKEVEMTLSALEEAKQTCLDTYLDELKDCAIAVGEKVTHISLQSSGSVIKRMIMAETEKLKKKAWIRIYMGKTDYDMLMQADADIVNELSKFSDHVKFVVMNKEKGGECIIEVPDEIIDISVDTQMENIRKILENM